MNSLFAFSSRFKVQCTNRGATPGEFPEELPSNSLPRVFGDVEGEICLEEVTSSLIQLESTSRDAHPPSCTKYHTWGNVLGLGVGAVTLKLVDRSLKVQAVAERLQAEWSDDLRDFLLDSFHPVSPASSRDRQRQPRRGESVFTSLDVQINCKHLDVFLMSVAGFCVGHRVDQVILDVGHDQLLLKLHGARVVSLFESDVVQVPLVESHAKNTYGKFVFGAEDVSANCQRIFIRINETYYS
jgi:hypothetical protein